jgi:Xaa-Pro aminopeptidase
MLADLDSLLTARDVECLIVPMHEAMHASFRWLTRGAKVTRGYAIKVVGREPLLIHYPMERDEAAASGIDTRSVHDFGFDRIFKSAPNAAAGYGELFDVILGELGVRESVLFGGNLPIHLYLDVVTDLENRAWRVHRPHGEDLVQLARKRKEAWELDAIRSVGERTERVVDGVRGMLRDALIDGDRLTLDGETLTLGTLKRFVSSEIVCLGMIEDHETILSQGRDAAIPHSRGDATAIIRPGVPLVIDIFPADQRSGYFFDLTRTFCVGEIPDEVARIHADVLEAFTRARDAMRAGTLASSYQALVCDFFESRGYPTLRENPAAVAGYVHGLGHGVGLDVHEKPSFLLSPNNPDLIEIGDVLTIEPGLYFPDRGIGIRIEDTLWIGDDGLPQTFCTSDRGLTP